MLSREDDDPPEEPSNAAQAPGAQAALEDAAHSPAGLGRWLQRRHPLRGAPDVRPLPYVTVVGEFTETLWEREGTQKPAKCALAIGKVRPCYSWPQVWKPIQ